MGKEYCHVSFNIAFIRKEFFFETSEINMENFGHPSRRLTDFILSFNCLTYLIDWLLKNELTMLGAKVNAAILQGQLWRLLTAVFLHANILHIIMNTISINSL